MHDRACSPSHTGTHTHTDTLRHTHIQAHIRSHRHTVCVCSIFLIQGILILNFKYKKKQEQLRRLFTLLLCVSSIANFRVLHLLLVEEKREERPCRLRRTFLEAGV